MVGAIVLIVLVVFFVLFGLPILVADNLGKRKRLSIPWMWGLTLGWIGVIIVASRPDPQEFSITPPRSQALTRRPPDNADLSVCPMCAEAIQPGWKVCPFCRNVLS
jgi:hypothetical protein